LHHLLAIALLAVLSGCGGGGADPVAAPVANMRPVVQSDLEIAQMLYVDNRRTPQGFYQDSAPPMQGYVATTHLKNTDLSPATAQYELCTDNWNTALGWSDQVATGAQASNLVATNTTTGYYEFGRVPASTPQAYIRARVFRCSYLDRSNVDLASAASVTSVAGQFNQRPLTAGEMLQLSEYLWQFTSYNNYGNAVLKSSGAVTSSSVQHTLIIASLTSAASSGACDHIHVAAWTHSANAQTGALTLSLQPLWDFGARRNAGLVEMCNPN
jgi:hypothetical protein